MTTPRRSLGLLPWVFPAMLLVGALDVLASGRDLAAHFAQLQAVAPAPRPPLAAWAQRVVSLLLLLAAIEQVANHFALRVPARSRGLLAAFIGYWVATIAAPALFGAHPLVGHELLYAPAAGIATCLASPAEKDRLLRLSRDTLLALMAAGLLLAPLRPGMVMDLSYADGLLPGIPRFAGLASHPVTQGLLALVALLLLWACPPARRRVRQAAWALALGVLVVAQSKTAWVAFLVCGLAMAGVRHGGAFWRRLSDPRRQGFGVAVCGALAALAAALALWVLSGEAGARLEDLLASEQGAQLVSLTGRDRIWAAAAQEWRAHPVFGYGLSLWDPAYRAGIGLPNATHAHNQFMDDAARAGSVGALALVAYGLVLAVLSVRRARATQGLALALFLAIALRSVSEVPLLLRSTDTELFTHLLLLATLAAAGPDARARAARASLSLRPGVAA